MTIKPSLLSMTLLALVAGCGDDNTIADLATQPDLSVASVADLSMPMRMAGSIPTLAQPEGLYWDSSSQTLFIATDQNQILAWKDTSATPSLAATFSGLGSSTLGGVTRTADGTLLTTRFGFGTDGAVLFVKPDGTTGQIPNADPKKERIGITVGPDGTIYEAYFLKNGPGAIATITMAGVETDIVTGLMQPVGVQVSGSNLIFDDQPANLVLKAPLSMPSQTTNVTTAITAPDELAAGGADGVVFALVKDGSVQKIAADGTLTQVAMGLGKLRGIAYDPDHKRVFVSVRAAAIPDAGPQESKVEILPVD
jgi:hypothetical protein